MADYVLTDSFYREWNRIRRKVDGTKFIGIAGKNSPDSLVIGPLSARPEGGTQLLAEGEFQITASRTKGGMYTAHPTHAQSTALDSSAAGSLTETTVFVADTSITVYLLNKREFGSSSHALSASGTPITYWGRFYGYDTDGTAIYAINECQ